MSNPRDNASVEIPEPIPAAPSAPGFTNRSTRPIGVEAVSTPGFENRSTLQIGVETVAVIKREKREDMLKKCSLGLRWSGFLFSFLAFVLMVSNRVGPINFEDFEPYSYLVAITIISSVYTAFQGIREVIQLVTKKSTSPQLVFCIIDFVADQILAYLLISAASAGVPLTNDGRKDSEYNSEAMKFVDMAAASISMAFLAFFTSALSVLISGYKLSAHFFI